MILLPVDIEGCCVSLTVSCVHLRGLCSVLVCQICLLWATGLTVCTVNSPSGANSGGTFLPRISSVKETGLPADGDYL